LQKLAEVALDLCKADSAGVSIAEVEDGCEIFRWRGAAGQMAPFILGTMPKDFSPCGYVLKTESPQLMVNLIGHYHYVSQLGVPLYEVLLVPFSQNKKLIGTIWVVAHTPKKQFDSEDLRLLTSLTRFASAAYQGKRFAENEKKSAQEAKRAIENERENFRNLFKQTPEIVCILSGPEHSFEFVNEAHVRVLGFDATGKTVRAAQPESVEVHDILDNVYRTGKTAELHEIPVTVGERLRYFNLTYSARTDIQQKINGIMILGAEVTDQVLFRESSVLQRRALELALNGAPTHEVLQILAKMAELQAGARVKAAIMLVDEEGKHLLHGGAPSLSEDYCRAVHGIEIQPDMGSCGAPAFRKELVIVEDISTDPRWKDYKDFAAEHGLAACWSNPILTSEGKLLGTFAFYSAVPRGPTEQETEVMELCVRTTALIVERGLEIIQRQKNQKQITENEQWLKQAKDEAERANRLKSAFLANMSHEIRTPLGAMIGFADLLRDPNISRDEHSSFVDILTRNANQLSIIIDDILDLSKVEAGHLKLEFLNVRPEQIATEVVSLMQVKARDKGLRLEYRPDPTTPSVISTDPIRLRQILLNLVGNAIKFTRSGSVQITSAGQKDINRVDIVAFEVTDTGIGIAGSQRDKIFEVFVQADNSMTRKFGGTGLGLALSRRLARALGGDVCIKSSSEGNGTTFLATIKNNAAAARETIPLSVESAQTGAEPEDIRDLKILIVDDSSDNQHLIWHYLSKYQVSLESAENGIEGFQKALQGDFDLVLMDLQMPLMDGYTATQKLRESGYKKPILALTAHAMTEVQRRCLNVGFSDHLAKPINFKELVRMIARHVAHSKAQTTL
jgi:signal transduction histidine kinase/ActR/RegA family two-component response regulator/PAS domain-containing protein